MTEMRVRTPRYDHARLLIRTDRSCTVSPWLLIRTWHRRFVASCYCNLGLVHVSEIRIGLSLVQHLIVASGCCCCTACFSLDFSESLWSSDYCMVLTASRMALFSLLLLRDSALHLLLYPWQILPRVESIQSSPTRYLHSALSSVCTTVQGTILHHLLHPHGPQIRARRWQGYLGAQRSSSYITRDGSSHHLKQGLVRLRCSDGSKAYLNQRVRAYMCYACSSNMPKAGSQHESVRTEGMSSVFLST